MKSHGKLPEALPMGSDIVIISHAHSILLTCPKPEFHIKDSFFWHLGLFCHTYYKRGEIWELRGDQPDLWGNGTWRGRGRGTADLCRLPAGG